MPHTSRIYRTIVATAIPLVPHMLRTDRDRRAHAARLAAPAAMATWAAAHRVPGKKLAWFHASSVGEGLQARAVMHAFRTSHPDVQLVYTHFSPSAEALAHAMPTDFSSYLPYDRMGDVTAALDALAPDLLVFTKLDLWPELATRAAARGTRVAMVAATVLPDSNRLRWPTRSLIAPGYQVLSAAGAVSTDDAARLNKLGVPRDRITVTGDPRVDSALDAVAAVDRDDPLTQIADPAVTLVAGSTWPADDAVLLVAFAATRKSRPDARLIVVPHEPTPEHLASLDAASARAGLPRAVRLSELVERDATQFIVADRVGVLARLYANGGIAYVGGGWDAAGIHSVLEPAALARPVIIGPHDRGSEDVDMLRRVGALVNLPREGAGSALARRWLHWLNDPGDRERCGSAGRAVMEGQQGAAERSMNVLEDAVDWAR